MSKATRPEGRLDGQGRVIPSTYDNLAFRGEYSSSNMIYAGFARAGAATNAAVWQISKMTYDVAGNVLSITWPENQYGEPSTEYEFIWDDRASLTYA